jgi:hypothetical protein
MDKIEAASWLAETKRSEHHWQLDPAHKLASDCLIYKGGTERGHFVAIREEGGKHWVSVGTYEDAIPHIGDAKFVRQGKKPLANALEARNWIKEKIGIVLFMSGTPVHCYIVSEPTGTTAVAADDEQPDYEQPDYEQPEPDAEQIALDRAYRLDSEGNDPLDLTPRRRR